MAYGVPFNEINTLTEGQQADEYRARKAKEEDDRRKEDVHSIYRSNGSGYEYAHNYRKAKEAEGKELSDDELDELYDKRHMAPSNRSRVVDKANRERGNSTGKYFSNAEFSRAKDAYHRHERRHPKNESSIFESVEII